MRPVRTLALAAMIIVAVPILYFSATVFGALIPVGPAGEWGGTRQSERVRVYLLRGWIHTDIAIPATPKVLEDFGFLREAGIPITHDDLRYLVFGWGSAAFYTTAGSYADISLSAVWTALTGDRSVMHAVPSGALEASDTAIAIDLTPLGFQQMVRFIRASYNEDATGNPVWLKGLSHGYGDVFHQARGGFDAFRPCNVWTARALRKAGVTTGIWTPTTDSLLFSLRLHAGDQLRQP